MNNKISNPLLKQLISEIANKANQGRINDLNWETLRESKNILKKEADEKAAPSAEKPKDQPPAPAKDAASKEKPASPNAEKSPKDAKGGDEKGPDAAPKDALSDLGKEAPSKDQAPEEDVEKAQTDAAEKQAELEKAKAEKAQAEKELEQQSYIKLKSSSGQKYLLGKILNHAFKTNTIDALASEMAQKLRITTPEDVATFEKDMALYKTIPGMAELISSIRDVAVEEPKKAPSEKEGEQNL